jgi:predicted membrane metal-binding protein
MSDEDKRTYKQLLLIAVLSICGILFLFALGTLYAEYSCFQIYYKNSFADLPEFCGKGNVTKFALELAGITVGMLGAIKLLGQ